MKRWIALALALVLALSITGCSCQKQPQQEPSQQTQQTKPSQQQSATLTGTMEENINKIMAQNPADFMGGTMLLDLKDTSEENLWMLKSYTGLESFEAITDGAVYEPMTGSQAFSLVLVRVANTADAKTVARQMKENIDPRKWICVGADQVMAAGYGDVVLFIMLDSALGKTAQSYVDTFASVCGSKPDFTL